MQLSLFDVPTLNIVRSLKESMANAAKRSRLSRDEICERMNQLAEQYGVRLMKGNRQQLSTSTLDKWLNPTDKERVIPVKGLPIFCAVVGSESPMSVLVEPLGFKVIGKKDGKLLAWAEHYQSAKSARAKMRKLEQEIL